MPKTTSFPYATELLRDFNKALDLEFDAPSDLMEAAEKAIIGCKSWKMRGKKERTERLIARINSKLKLNKGRFQEFLDWAAKNHVILNYHDKIDIAKYFDYNDKTRLEHWLSNTVCEKNLSYLFNPITKAETLTGLNDLLSTGKVNRSDAKHHDLSEQQKKILRSLFGSYVFDSFPTQSMHECFNIDSKIKYHSDFYRHLLEFHSTALHRDCALVYLSIDQTLFDQFSSDQLRDALYSFISRTYERLANHCYLAIKIKPFREGKEDGQWRLFSDLVLYAEKHREVSLQTGYFRPKDIEAATRNHIPDLNLDEAHFELANEGFFFRDCFVLSALTPQKNHRQETTYDNVELLILLEKNERDERVIPCPSCRSFDVRGNSYPALGIRSWECQNPLCPDRSAYDRGNRYSLSSIIKQEAIKSECNQIPEESLRRWKLDVVFDVDHEAITDMLIQHFSLHGDSVIFVNEFSSIEEKHGRRIVHETFASQVEEPGVYKKFQESAFFKRFLIDRQPASRATPIKVIHKIKGASLYHGDCFEVLFGLKGDCADGAVTSPPYYNARTYTTWPNIYCYLYDMYNSARAVFHALSPGSIYVFNIFDYFDNENSIAFSAMGKKRMILGPYIINIFRRIGFELERNVIWYKGEIEGKRNFNQGNRSPYYQFPFNCWEHCLIFRKPSLSPLVYSFPSILDIKPVIKMIRGKNILGHTAPFPPAIPKLLTTQMRKGQCVLDPFSGSMTTGRVAYQQGLRSISIEMHQNYCDLGIRLLEKENCQNSDLLYFPAIADKLI